MGKPQIILLTEEAKLAAQSREWLSEIGEVSVFEKLEDFISVASSARLAIIDFDLKEVDGLLAFRKLHETNPYLKTIMLSVTGNIPLAVSATRLGVFNFLKKPLESGSFLTAVSEALKVEGRGLTGREEIFWLAGRSTRLSSFLSELAALTEKKADLIALAERGIEVLDLARFIHLNSPQPEKKLVALNAALYQREEGHFWNTLQELLAAPDLKSARPKEEITGTLYLYGLEELSDHFLQSLIEYLARKKTEVRVMLRFIEKVPRGIKVNLLIPPLRERREDLPYMLAELLSRRSISMVSLKILEFFGSYDFPGNYDELQALLQFGGAEPHLSLSDLPINFESFKSAELNQAENLPLPNLQAKFEADYISLLLEKIKDHGKAARFLDLPKTAFNERIKQLRLETKN